MKLVLLSIAALTIFWGCSAKEINSTTNSITSDITKAFEDSKDKSAHK